MSDATPLPPPECPRKGCPATIDHGHGVTGAPYACARQIGQSCLYHEGGDGLTTRCYAPRTPARPALRPLTEDDYRAARDAYFRSDRSYVNAAVDAVHARLAADCQPAPQPTAIAPGDVRVGDRIRAEWDKVVVEAEVFQVRVVGRDVWASIGGLLEKNLTYCARVLLLDRPEPEDPAVAVVEEWITESLRGQAREDAIRDLLKRVDEARNA